MNSTPNASALHALHLLRDHARDEYFALSTLPPSARAALLPIAALEVELREIALKTSEEIIGHIRFAWWREQLQKLEAGQAVSGHPLLELLQVPMTSKAINFAMLEPVMDAVQNAYPTYLSESTDALHSLILQLLNDTDGAKYSRARMLIHRHRTAHGARKNIWLLMKLFFA